MNTQYLTNFIKNKNNVILFIILIIGIAFMLFPVGEKEMEIKPTQLSEQDKLTQIISGIKGAGKTDVMITYYGSNSSNIVYDIRTRGDETERKAVVSDGCAVTTGESFPRVRGVVVTAEGASTPSVKKSIISAVTVALDIPEYKVTVLERR